MKILNTKKKDCVNMYNDLTALWGSEYKRQATPTRSIFGWHRYASSSWQIQQEPPFEKGEE